MFVHNIRSSVMKRGVKVGCLVLMLSVSFCLFWQYTETRSPALIFFNDKLTYDMGHPGVVKDLHISIGSLKNKSNKSLNLTELSVSMLRSKPVSNEINAMGMKRRQQKGLVMSKIIDENIGSRPNAEIRQTERNIVNHEMLTGSILQHKITTPKAVKSWKENLDLMKLKPFKFLPNYKNPCWETDKTSQPIACLPFFCLIGAPKAGTTDIYTRLHAHPDYAATLSKGNQWLTRNRFSAGRSSIYFYSQQYFSEPIKEICKCKDKENYHRKITGDLSASTLFDNHNWPLLPHNASLQEPELTNADYLYHLNPDLRIIATLREPVDRLYSEFLYFNKKDSQSEFHLAVKRMLDWFNGCLQKKTLRACVYDSHDFAIKKSTARILIGIYHVHLKEFMRVFPRQHILPQKLEEFAKDPVLGMRRIFRFLGLSETAKLNLSVLGDSEKHANPRRKADSKKEYMWNKTRVILQNFYRPHNDALASLLNDASFNYNDMYH